MLIQIYLTAAFLLFHLSGWAQHSPHFRFQKISGLSQHTVYNILQDKQGFLWLGTGDGLNRYDGRGFTIYKPSVHSGDGSIGGRIIRHQLVENNVEQLWVSSESGLQFLDKRTDRFNFLVPFKDPRQNSNGAMFGITQHGPLQWFGKIAYGLFSYNAATKAYLHYPFPGAIENPSRFLGEKAVFDGREHIWISHQAGLYSFNIHTKKYTVYLSQGRLSHFCLVNQTLYIIAPGGILLFDIITHKTHLVKSALPFNQYRCITRDRNNDVFTGDVAGNINKIGGADSLLTHIGNINKSATAIYPVYSLYFDRSDILWIGTDGLGLLKASVYPPGFYQFPDDASGNGVFVKSIYEEENGDILLGTFGQGVLQLNKHTYQVIPLKKGLPKQTGNDVKVVSFMQEDEFKNLWVGFGDQLFCRQYGQATFMPVPLSIKGSKNRLRITGMSKYKDRWLISTTLQVFNLKAAKKVTDSKLVPCNTISDFAFIHTGEQQQIIGYSEGGLILYSEAEAGWTYKKHLVSRMGFKCVYTDEANQLLWFGTDKGLMVFNPITEKYRLFTEADGLGNSYVYAILEREGQLWLSTNGGLCNVTIINDKKNELPGIRCRNYRQQDGLQGDEFNTGAYLKGRDGTLYFGGINGINWVAPNSNAPVKDIDRLAITQLTVNDAPADSTLSPQYIKQLHLQYNHNNLYLRFHALEFSDPENIQYSYQLVGWDNNWINSKTNNEVRYNNLSPGKYQFKVRASNAAGTWSNAAHSIVIRIAPPFWKTWWFYLTCCLAASCIIAWIGRKSIQWKLKKEIARLEQQRTLYAERMRIAQDMHDDIGAGLTQIGLMSESAKLHYKGANGIREELEDISSTSRQLVDNIGEIIWSLNPQHNTLEVLLYHVREQVNKLTEYASLDCVIQFPANIPAIEINNQQRRNILLVTKEIVHNAIKHSAGKNIRITVEVEQQELLFEITDDGRGFDTTLVYQGNGIRNIRQRIHDAGGILQLSSLAGKGTNFRYHFSLA